MREFKIQLFHEYINLFKKYDNQEKFEIISNGFTGGWEGFAGVDGGDVHDSIRGISEIVTYIRRIIDVVANPTVIKACLYSFLLVLVKPDHMASGSAQATYKMFKSFFRYVDPCEGGHGIPLSPGISPEGGRSRTNQR